MPGTVPWRSNHFLSHFTSFQSSPLVIKADMSASYLLASLTLRLGHSSGQKNKIKQKQKKLCVCARAHIYEVSDTVLDKKVSTVRIEPYLYFLSGCCLRIWYRDAVSVLQSCCPNLQTEASLFITVEWQVSGSLVTLRHWTSFGSTYLQTCYLE